MLNEQYLLPVALAGIAGIIFIGYFISRKVKKFRNYIYALTFLAVLIFTYYFSKHIYYLQFLSEGRPNYYIIIIYFLLALVIIRTLNLIIFDYLLYRKRGVQIPILLREIFSALLIIVAFFIINDASGLGIDLGGLLTTSAILSIVLGLAMQDTLGNLFAGIALHLESSIDVGDWVKIGEYEGKIEELSWRAIKLRTLPNDYITIPNNLASKESIQNFSFPRSPHRRSIFVGVNYGVPPGKVVSVIFDALKQVDHVERIPAPEVFVVSYDDFSIEYEIRYWLKDYKYHQKMESEMRRMIWYYFKRNDIVIPFPIRDVFIHKEKKMEEVQAVERESLLETFKTIDIFKALSGEELQSISRQMKGIRYGLGESVIKEGNDGDSFFVLAHGEAEVSIQTKEGKKKHLAMLPPGSYFGEGALLTGEKRSATVSALADILVYRLDKKTFGDILTANPKIAEEISKILTHRQEEREDLREKVGEESRLEQIMQERNKILTKIVSWFGLSKK